MNNLKNYKNKELQYFIYTNLLIITLFSTKISHKFFINNYDFILSLFTFLANMGIVYTYSNILDSILPTNIKNILVFGKTTKIPGNKAITKVFNKNYSDPRVSTTKLRDFYQDTWNEIVQKKHHNELYQNKKWYNLYISVRNESIIFFSNSNYLLARDISVLSILFVIFYPFMQIFPYIYYNYILHIYFVFIWILTIFAAHETGKKFANNVLIENYYKGRRNEHS